MSIASPWFSLQPYPRWPLPYLLEAAAARYPDRTAFINFDGRSYTFEQMWSGARRIARFLQEKGLTKGDRVGILAPNCPEYVVAFYGTLLAGGVLTTFNPLYREREVQHQLEDAGAVVLFHSTLHGPLVDGVRDGAKTVRHYLNLDEIWTLADSVAGEPARVAIDPEEDLAALPYSSGTTGLPKGVMLTHFNLVSNVRQINGVGMLDRYSVLLDFLPFYHIYGLTVLMNSGLAAGASQVVVPRFDPELILQLVANRRATHLLVVPPALLVLASMPDLGRFDTSSLLWIISGAAPLPPEVGFRAQEAFHCTVLQGFGLTETSPFLNTSPGYRVKMASVGPPVSDTEEKVVDLDSGAELGPGQVGEILVRGPQIMKGYWQQPQATAATLTEDGWLRPGEGDDQVQGLPGGASGAGGPASRAPGRFGCRRHPQV